MQETKVISIESKKKPDKKSIEFVDGYMTIYVSEETTLDFAFYSGKLYISEDGEARYEGPPFKTLEFIPYDDPGVKE